MHTHVYSEKQNPRKNRMIKKITTQKNFQQETPKKTKNINIQRDVSKKYWTEKE